MVGDNTVTARLLAAGTPALSISTNVTKDADIDIIASFHSLGRCHFELAPRHPGHGIVSSKESASG